MSKSACSKVSTKLGNWIIAGTKGYVAGFNSQHQIVQWTKKIKEAKKFRYERNALQWLELRVDCGYGLSSDDTYTRET